MCGRYTLHANQRTLEKALNQSIPPTYESDYNIGPGREILVITKPDFETTAATLMTWGLRTPQNFHINARLETADTTPRFRDSWEATRCLLPANGFYEWYQDGITKVPYYIYPTNDDLCYFAGLWIPASANGEPSTCVVLTTEAHESVRPIHERMPVMLRQAAHSDWLNGTLDKQATLELSADVNLTKHTVSRRVNSTHNKDSGVINATSPLVDDQMMLF